MKLINNYSRELGVPLAAGSIVLKPGKSNAESITAADLRVLAKSSAVCQWLDTDIIEIEGAPDGWRYASVDGDKPVQLVSANSSGEVVELRRLLDGAVDSQNGLKADLEKAEYQNDVLSNALVLLAEQAKTALGSLVGKYIDDNHEDIKAAIDYFGAIANGEGVAGGGLVDFDFSDAVLVGASCEKPKATIDHVGRGVYAVMVNGERVTNDSLTKEQAQAKADELNNAADS